MILINFKGTQIKGTSEVDAHDMWIPVNSMQMGAGRSINTEGKTRKGGASSVSEVTFTHSGDMSSPELFFQACGGPDLGVCEVHILQAQGSGSDIKHVPYIMIELENAMITSYSMSSGGEHPDDSFSVNFSKISYQFDNYEGSAKTAGTPKKWDLTKGMSY